MEQSREKITQEQYTKGSPSLRWPTPVIGREISGIPARDTSDAKRGSCEWRCKYGETSHI